MNNVFMCVYTAHWSWHTQNTNDKLWRLFKRQNQLTYRTLTIHGWSITALLSLVVHFLWRMNSASTILSVGTVREPLHFEGHLIAVTKYEVILSRGVLDTVKQKKK